MARTPEEVIEQLRALRDDIADEIHSMTAQQRRDLRNRTRSSYELILSSAGAIGMSDTIATAVGKSSAEVQELIMAEKRWRQLEGELLSFWNAVSSAGLARRLQLDQIATQTFAVTKSLIRNPQHENLVSIFEEMQAIRKNERRKKRRKTEEPAPE